MAKKFSKAASETLAKTDWKALDAMTDSDIARQIVSNRDAAPDMAPELDVRAIRRSAGMTQSEFAAAYSSASARCRNGSGAPSVRAARRERCSVQSRPIPRG